MSTPNVIGWDQAYNRNGNGKLPRAAVNVIRTYVDNDTLTGWVRQETIANATGLDVRSVRRQINANVDAGWLEIVEKGNSSGRASSYRLTYPEADTDVRIDDGSKADVDVRIETARRTQMSGKGGHPRPVKADTDVRPTSPVTTPGTSPKRSSIETDPFGGDRVSHDTSNRKTTSECNADTDVRLPKVDADVRLGPESDPWSSTRPKAKPAESFKPVEPGWMADPWAVPAPTNN